MSNNADTSDAEELTAALSLLFAELMGPDAPRPTVSYGIAHVDKEWSLNATIQRADQAMYQAKRSGRDRTAVDGATDA